LSLYQLNEQLPAVFHNLVESKKFNMIKTYVIPMEYEEGESWCVVNVHNDFCVELD